MLQLTSLSQMLLILTKTAAFYMVIACIKLIAIISTMFPVYFLRGVESGYSRDGQPYKALSPHLQEKKTAKNLV